MNTQSRGPMTFSTFWQMCMQHPQYGYYMTADPIGKEGDFITTPEMFSGFSECLAVWCAFTWESMGRPPKIKIIEYGPGMGSVARTMLDVVRKAPLKPFKDAISLHLIESSPRLRWKQKTKLGLGNIRKFKSRVRKPVYAVTDVAQYAQRDPSKELKAKNNNTKTKELEKPQFVSSEEYHQNPETKTRLTSLDELPQLPKKGGPTVSAINTDPEIRVDPKKKIRPIVGSPQKEKGMEKEPQFKTRDDIPPELLEPTPPRDRSKSGKKSNVLTPGEDLEDKMRANPFKTDRVFGEMPQRAMHAAGIGGEMALTDEMKEKYKPFDWSQYPEEVFGHVDEEMKPHITGQATRDWEARHSEIKVAEDPLTAKPKEKEKERKKTGTSPPVQKSASLLDHKIEDTTSAGIGGMMDSGSGSAKILDSSREGGSIKVYDEPLSEHGNSTTLPPRRTKRDLESEAATKSELGFDEQFYRESQAESESPVNPFQPILDKIEMTEVKGGTGAGIDFTDLLDHEDLRSETTEETEEIWQARTKDGILVSWHSSLHSVDASPAMFICHEFFDALPISHFEFRPHGWVETVVDVNDEEDTPEHFKLVRGPVATFASTVLDRQFAAKGVRPSIGQQFSICSEGNEIANHIAKWCKQHGGAGFIVDYGAETIPSWTVQGIKQHKPANILSRPGEVDISAHVNFTALKAAIESVQGMKTHGPVTQSYFLQGCGIVERFRQYVKEVFDADPEKDKEEKKKQRQDFFETFAKIMDVDKLGGHFKVIGFGRENLGVPIGFRTPMSDKQAAKAGKDEFGLPLYK